MPEALPISPGPNPTGLRPAEVLLTLRRQCPFHAVEDRYDLVDAAELDNASDRRAAQCQPQLTVASADGPAGAQKIVQAGGIAEHRTGEIRCDDFGGLRGHDLQELVHSKSIGDVYLPRHRHYRVPSIPSDMRARHKIRWEG